MRKILYLFIAALSFMGCNKNSDPDLIFGSQPEERMAERNAELKTKLLESAGGWKAFLRTSLRGGGYGFYMQFDGQDGVRMLSDFSNATATTFKASTYRIKYVMNTSLIFDTYNYITTLQDPTASVNGGTNANGLQSDIEFEYLRSTSDSVVLIGKRYRNYLYLIKASAAEKTSFENGGYLSAMNATRNYFLNNANAYIDVPNGGSMQKLALSFNNANKTITGQSLFPGDSVSSVTAAFGFGIDGAFVNSQFRFLGNSFRAIRMKSATAYVVVDSTGKEYEIKHNPIPLVPLSILFGTTITTVTVPNATTYGGWGSDFITRRATSATNVTRWSIGGNPLSFGTMTIRDISQVNRRFTIRINTPYTGGALDLDYPYTYVVNADGTYKFTIGTTSGNAASIQGDFAPLLAQRINVDKFTIDYFVNPANGQALIQFKSVENPTFTFAGTF